MNFSFCLIPDMPLAEAAAIAARAEDWADLLWVPDEAFMRDPYVVLATLAARTRIPLGVGIANPYTRHPMQMARAIATIADLRPEGVVFGIGAGLKSTRGAIGAPDTEFVQTTRDCITVMKRLLASETVTFEGPAFRLERAHMEFKPTAPVTILVASTHREAFEMAGAAADGIIVGNVAVPSAMRQVVAWMRDGAGAAGRDPAGHQVVAWNFVVCVDDPEPAYDRVRLMIARSIAITHREVRGLLGIDPATWKRVHAAVRHGAEPVTRDVVTNAMIDKYAIIGPPAHCRARIAELRAAGATGIGVRTSLDLMKAYDWEATLRRLRAALGDLP